MRLGDAGRCRVTLDDAGGCRLLEGTRHRWRALFHACTHLPHAPPSPQTRGLQGTAFRTDPDKFREYAEASLALCDAYVSLYESGSGSARDLAAARMHLTGLLSQARDRFDETEEYARLRALQQQVAEAEQRARAAAA
jgi:hypothetical protein